MAFTSKDVIKKIKVPNWLTLELVKGEGYWYFVADSRDLTIHETKSVYCMFLNQMDIGRWVDDGKAFVEELEVIKKERDERRVNGVRASYHTMTQVYVNLDKRGD